MTIRRRLPFLALICLLAAPMTSARAEPACGSGTFEAWLGDFKNEAAAKGIARDAIDTGLAGVTLDQSVLNRDKSQKVFTQTFEEFSGRMVPPENRSE